MPSETTDGSSTCVIPCAGTVQCVEFSPFEWSSQLLAVGTSSSGVSVYSCRFQEEGSEIKGNIEYTRLKDFPMKCSPLCIAWSPQTSLHVLPKIMSFAVASDDRTLKVFASDMNSSNSMKILWGHKGFVNALTFDPSEGIHLASTGDDMTCRVWTVVDAQQAFLFQLTSPGMAVAWHSDEPYKLMVAQKDGLIRFFSLHNQQPIQSLSCGQGPLLSADWSRHNNLLVGAVSGSDWLVFDVSSSSLPIERRPAHAEGARLFRWSRCHESLVATCGRPGRQLKVFNTRHQQEHVNTSLKVAYSLSWHLTLPILAVGGDKAVHMWSVKSL
ncbi:nucleoporin nup37 [Plakobranchus ocellatus]|uniref:Nucleoporin Nup37 n=1 Tax=Plakobranchus ocellatus TaxID=259542 RepID=A0AAV4B1W9_9GAST|nr:nucleoporin nup37 [Plakobranchus ocellatus]